MRRRRAMPVGRAVVALTVAILAACAGFKTYHGPAERNLLIRMHVSGTFWRAAAARVHIFRVRRECDAEYRGMIALDQTEQRVGLPVGERSYLKFEFETAPRWGIGGSSISYATMLQPRAGSAYTADVRYADAMYEVVFREDEVRLEPNVGACTQELQP